MKFRILDAFFLMAIAALIYIQVHIDPTNVNRVTAPRSMGDKSYICGKCGWKPRDDGPMNRQDTFEPLVAAGRIDDHEWDHYEEGR